MSAAPATRKTRTKRTTRKGRRKRPSVRSARQGSRSTAARRRRARRRRATWRPIWTAGIAVAMAVVVGAAVLLVAWPLAEERTLAVCPDTPTRLPAEGIAGWRGEQLEHAATIMQTATSRGLGRDGQILGVMAAMGESSLRTIDYGDAETSGVTNPDGSRTTSIGLFQQQEWWGSVEQRMDPATAAGLFFDRLERVPEWAELDESLAIHRVQINRDPTHYSRYLDDATAVVDALTVVC